MTTELHPLGFFLPENTRLLMLGSFPPPRARWSMDFYYPNIQNDMWRILGLIFYGNKDAFLRDKKAFSEEKAKAFCREKGIGIGDTAMEVIRLKANASDKFLEVVRPIDPEKVLSQIPECVAIVVTGQKAMDTLLSVLPVGGEGRYLPEDVRDVGDGVRQVCHTAFLVYAPPLQSDYGV